MAGSINHIVGEDGKFTMEYIENLGDAQEALEECFDIIRHVTGGRKRKINKILKKYGYPAIRVDMKAGDN